MNFKVSNLSVTSDADVHAHVCNALKCQSSQARRVKGGNIGQWELIALKEDIRGLGKSSSKIP